MTFKEIVMARNATKSFDGKKIPQEKIEELLHIIRHAETSYNVQPWRVMIIEDDDRKRILAGAAWNQPQVTSCSHLLVFCANTELESLTDRLEARMLEAGTPKEKVEPFIGAIRGFIKGLHGDNRLAWAQRQTYLALGNGINGAKALGFDSCPMEGFQPEEFAKILGLPETIVPTVLMTIGHAKDTPHPKLRFSREEMFFEKA